MKLLQLSSVQYTGAYTEADRAGEKVTVLFVFGVRERADMFNPDCHFSQI